MAKKQQNVKEKREGGITGSVSSKRETRHLKVNEMGKGN